MNAIIKPRSMCIIRLGRGIKMRGEKLFYNSTYLWFVNIARSGKKKRRVPMWPFLKHKNIKYIY